MTATILQIPNEPHLAVIREAMRQSGHPLVIARHPFEGLPFWSRRSGKGRAS